MSRRLLILLALLMAAILVSGCCCCCGDRRYFSPGTHPTTYRVTVVPAPHTLTPQPTMEPAVSPVAVNATDVASPGR